MSWLFLSSQPNCSTASFKWHNLTPSRGTCVLHSPQLSPLVPQLAKLGNTGGTRLGISSQPDTSHRSSHNWHDLATLAPYHQDVDGIDHWKVEAFTKEDNPNGTAVHTAVHVYSIKTCAFKPALKAQVESSETCVESVYDFRA